MKRLFISILSLPLALLAGCSSSMNDSAYHSSSEGGVVRADNSAGQPVTRTNHQANNTTNGATSGDNDCDCGDRR